MKKLLVAMIALSLLLAACGTPTITADYDKVAEKVYKIGELLGKTEGDFQKITLGEDDVEYSDEVQDYSQTIAYLTELEEAYKRFGGNIGFNADLALLRILLKNNGQAQHITKSFSIIHEETLGIVPQKYIWYFEFGYQTNLLEEVLTRFQNEEGIFQAPGENFSVPGFVELQQNLSPDLGGAGKRALSKIAGYEQEFGLDESDLQNISASLKTLLEVF
ncbi:MAG: hypothetical protein PHU71_01340 [Candidatus Gracilibacteria bacterium]|nr:hypothetical protein [Candidatus Gracilibacteria bacterium]